MNRNEVRRVTEWTRNERLHVECALFDLLSRIRGLNAVRVSFHRSSPLPQAVRLFLDPSRSHLTSATSAAARLNLARLSRARELAFALREGINSQPLLVHIISPVAVFRSPQFYC